MIALVIGVMQAAQVARVVVYPDRAQVTRAQDLACDAHKAEFLALPPSADPSSVRAQTSEGGVESVDVLEEPRATAFSAEVEQLDEQIRRLDAQLVALRDAREKAQNTSRLAAGLEDAAALLVSGEMTQPAPDVKAWRAAFASTLQARLGAARERARIAAEERELQRQRGDLQQKRARLGVARSKRERRAEVLVSCPSGRTARVELTYTVGGAGWEPAYEARADEAAGVVGLSLYATVRQSTGEDWQKAQLALSTAVPSQDATPPELSPLRVFADPREPPKKVLVRRDELQRHAEAGEAQGGNARGMEVAQQGLSVQLLVKGPADVPGDGTPARLFVASAQLPARFAWRTAPRQAPFVFRAADLDDTAPFPLLAGQVDLFRKSAYLGRLSLGRVAQGERFHLSFGLEEGVRVKRIVVEEIARDQGLFNSAQRFRYAYRFELENHLGRPEQVELAEAIPVSELSDVHVELEDRTTKGFERNEEDGIVTWKLKLAPGEKRSLELAFHVDVPNDYVTGN
jgi:uncharacterized protein (TIGR02231 family)